MYMGEPVAQIYLVDNGILVMTVDQEARDEARAAADKKSPKGACCPSDVNYSDFEKKMVFSNIGEVMKFLAKQLPVLAGDLKGKAAFDAAFNETKD